MGVGVGVGVWVCACNVVCVELMFICECITLVYIIKL